MRLLRIIEHKSQTITVIFDKVNSSIHQRCHFNYQFSEQQYIALAIPALAGHRSYSSTKEWPTLGHVVSSTRGLTELEGREGRRVELEPEVLAPPARGDDGPADHGALEGRAAAGGDDHIGVVRHGAARDAPPHAVRLQRPPRRLHLRQLRHRRALTSPSLSVPLSLARSVARDRVLLSRPSEPSPCVRSSAAHAAMLLELVDLPAAKRRHGHCSIHP